MTWSKRVVTENEDIVCGIGLCDTIVGNGGFLVLWGTLLYNDVLLLFFLLEEELVTHSLGINEIRVKSPLLWQGRASFVRR